MKFSVTVPAFKRKYLKECIDSVLSQTYKDFELIIVNDASPEDLDSVVKQYDDSRIRYYVNEKNCGAIDVVDNWNICLGYAKGEYVICMGDDDRLIPNCLEEYSKLIDKYPGIGLLHGWTEIIDEDSKPYMLGTKRCEHESCVSLIWHRWYSYHIQFIGDFCFNTEWLRQQGGFYKIPLAWGSDDISAYIGAMKNGVANTQTVVFQYRKNPYTISSTGNVTLKLEAITQEYLWYVNFLKNVPTDEYDKLYHNELLKNLENRFDKKKGLYIATDLKKSHFHIFKWIGIMGKYQISKRALLYAITQSFK